MWINDNAQNYNFLPPHPPKETYLGQAEEADLSKIANQDTNKTAELSVDAQIARARDTIRQYPLNRRKIYFFVGVQSYKNYPSQPQCHPNTPLPHENVNNLRYPKSDISRIKGCFKPYHSEDIIFILTNANATKANIEKIFAFLCPKDSDGNDTKEGYTQTAQGKVPNCNPKDYCYIFYSGHGYEFETSRAKNKGEVRRKSFLIPYDADLEDLNYKLSVEEKKKIKQEFAQISGLSEKEKAAFIKEKIEEKEYPEKHKSFISMEYFTDALCRIPAIKPVFLDACYSAGFFGKGKGLGSGFQEAQKIIEAFKEKFDKGFLGAAVQGEFQAFEFGKIEGGVYFTALELGLGCGDSIGLADTPIGLTDRDLIKKKGNRVITERELAIYLKKSVPRLMELVVLDRYLTKVVGGMSVFEHLCAVYTPKEIKEARQTASEIGHRIPSDVSKFTIQHLWIVSMIIERNAYSIWEKLKGKGNFNSRMYNRLIGLYTQNEIEQAYKDAELDGIRIQWPQSFDNYLNGKNNSKDMVIKAEAEENQYEIQENQDNM